MSDIDDWEQIDETQLNNKLDLLKKNAMRMNETPISGPMILMNDDDFRQYGPTEPTVKILKRPTQNGEKSQLENKPKPRVKTLQEREQEYAKARLRILGSAKNPDEESNGCQSTHNSIETGKNFQRPAQSSNCLTNGVAKISEENILRMPRGPDGSTGFTMRR